MSPFPSLQQNAYLLAAGVIASIYVICAVILTLGVREQRGEGSWGGVQAPAWGGFVPLPGPQAWGGASAPASPSPLAPRTLRDSAGQADALLSGPPAGHEPWPIHQAYCRLPLHLLGFHGESGPDMLSPGGRGYVERGVG